MRPSQVIDGRLVGFDLTSAHVGNSGPAILRLGNISAVCIRNQETCMNMTYKETCIVHMGDVACFLRIYCMDRNVWWQNRRRSSQDPLILQGTLRDLTGTQVKEKT